MHEPQLVPARSVVPISATEQASPDESAAAILLRPTPKQAQTTGPSDPPDADFPDNNIRRC